jgi:hypothetical protein
LAPASAIFAQGRPPQPVVGPTVISESGNYSLKRGFRMTRNDVAIRITANNVTLDLAGEALEGPGGRLGIAISIEGASNVSVMNGKVSGFGIGVKAIDSANVKIQTIQVTGHDLGGAPPVSKSAS